MFYSVCIPAVLGKLNTNDALCAVAEAGFSHYEICSWWDRDMDEYLALQKELGLSIEGILVDLISLVNAECHDAYLEALKKTVAMCQKMGCKKIISQVGQEMNDLSRAQQHANLVAGLRRCVPYLEEAGITLMIEPLNTKIDHIGYYLWQSKEAFEIIDEVGSANVKVIFDLYHQHIMNDLVIEDIVKNIDKIAHFHMAGHPGRHEPLVKNEIDYIPILTAIRDCGYQGGIGLEYMPVNDPVQGLKELCGQLPK